MPIIIVVAAIAVESVEHHLTRQAGLQLAPFMKEFAE